MIAGDMTEDVIAALRRIIRAIDLHSRFLVSRYGLTNPQLAVLKALSGRRPTAVRELSDAVHLSQATVTGILDRLEKRGLIQRRRSDQDRRCVMVRLSRSGEEAIAAAPPMLQEHFTAKFSRLEQWEQTQILSSLQRVVCMMEAKDLDAAPILTTGPIPGSGERTKARPDQKPPGPEPGFRQHQQDLSAQDSPDTPPQPTPRRTKGASPCLCKDPNRSGSSA